MSEIRRPRLLTEVYTEGERLNPSYLSAQVSLWPLSIAKMSLPEGEPTIKVRDMVEIFGPDESLGYFRVSSVSLQVGNTQEVDLEHSISTLDDDLTGKDETLTGDMTTILKALLAKQKTKRWTLGEVECTKTGLTLKADMLTLREAVVDAVKLVDDYGMFYEQSGARWLLHVRKLPAEPTFECRVSRNTSSVEIRIDDQDLCTRVVDESLPGGEMSVDSPEWGLVTKRLNIPAGTNQLDAQKYVQAYLQQHKDPNVSIKAGAQELADITGEQLDVFEIGGMGRVALPDWGIVQDKRLILKDWPNLLQDPRKVYLTMSKPERRIEEIVARNRSSGGRSAAQANDAERDIVICGQRIALLADGLEDAEAQILLRVQKGEIISEINLDASGVTIKASKINLVGYVTANQLTAWGGNISATELYGDIVKAAALWLNGTHVVTRNVQGTDGNIYRALVLSTAGN